MGEEIFDVDEEDLNPHTNGNLFPNLVEEQEQINAQH